jgi:hypothetical protein
MPRYLVQPVRRASTSLITVPLRVRLAECVGGWRRSSMRPKPDSAPGEPGLGFRYEQRAQGGMALHASDRRLSKEARHEPIVARS